MCKKQVEKVPGQPKFGVSWRVGWDEAARGQGTFVKQAPNEGRGFISKKPFKDWKEGGNEVFAHPPPRRDGLEALGSSRF